MLVAARRISYGIGASRIVGPVKCVGHVLGGTATG